jgi:Glycosyltransferase family 87
VTRERIEGGAVWVLLGVLAALGLVTMPYLGADAWPFEPTSVEPRGILGPLVRAADEEWDLGLIRSAAVLSILLVALAAAVAVRIRSWNALTATAVTLCVVGLLLVPAVLLQVGLRDATAPWFHTNDSTYQIEIGGDLLLDGDNPYGHDYSFSGLERFYELDGTVSEDTREEQVALRHFAYFPGTVVTAAGWRLLPRPFDDYRVFVLLATLGLFAAVMLFPAPLGWRLPLAAAAAANPMAIRAAWFGNADAPSLLCVVLAFALLTRSRYVLAAALLAAAITLKQFAIVAVPFFVLALLLRSVSRPTLVRAGAAFAGVLAVITIPFAVADPQALWDDTIEYGAQTYRIVGYGLSALLLNLGILDDRWGPYPFTLLVVLVWLPFTGWLLWNQWRERSLWLGGAGFAASIFMLVFLGRVFQRSYVLWPLIGIVLAGVLYAVERRRPLDPVSAPHADDDRGRERTGVPSKVARR